MRFGATARRSCSPGEPTWSMAATRAAREAPPGGERAAARGGEVGAARRGKGQQPHRVARHEAVAGAAPEGLDAQREPGHARGHPDGHGDEVEDARVLARGEDVEAVEEAMGPAGEGHGDPRRPEVREAERAPVAAQLEDGHGPVLEVDGPEQDVEGPDGDAHWMRTGIPIWRMNSRTAIGSPTPGCAREEKPPRATSSG